MAFAEKAIEINKCEFAIYVKETLKPWGETQYRIKTDKSPSASVFQAVFNQVVFQRFPKDFELYLTINS